jgi:acetylornithine aminotransferase
MSEHLMSTYAPLAVTFEKGEGAWLWDNNDNKYLDAISGIAVCGLGHAHPAITQALCAQASKLVHTSNLYQIGPQQILADKLAEVSGMDKIFFSNSGAEANEAAIKLARLYGNQRGIKTPTIIVAQQSFHGRTMATLSASGNRKIHAGFEPLVQGFLRVEYNNLEAIKNIAETNKEVVAIMIEPIQGEGGVNIPDANYLNEVRALCDQHEWLMILDEIQTGMCRTGKWFAFQHNNLSPDIMTLAKGLGNGVPIGACLAKGKAAELFAPGNHGSTFGGNPLACSAAIAVIETLKQQKLDQHAAKMGEHMLSGFQASLATAKHVKEIRGKGLMIGIELDRPCSELVAQALEQGFLINVTADQVVRLLPPLIIDEKEADLIVNEVSNLILNFASAAK